MEEHGTHLSKHEAKGGLRSALRVLLVCFIVIAINLQLTYFDRAPYGAWSARYILKLFGDVSFVPLVEAYFLYHLVERLGEEVERWPIIYLFPAAFFAFTTIEGRSFETKLGVEFLNPEKFFVILCLIAAVGYLFIYYFVLVAADLAFTRMRQGKNAIFERICNSRLSHAVERHPYLTSIAFLTLIAVPLLYIAYPALFMGDTRRQLLQAFRYHQLYNKHPVLHTLFLRYCLAAGNRLFGSYNAGIFLSSVLQSAFIIAAMAFFVATLVKIEGARGYVAFLVPLTFVFNPRCLLFFIMVTKDTLYCAMLLFYLSLTLRVAHGRPTRVETVAWVLAALGVGLFRRDGLYVILPVAMLLALMYRKMRVSAAALVVVSLAFFWCWSNVVLPAMNVAPGSPRVKYSVPFQMTAYYLVEHPEDITTEEHDTIDKVLKVDKLAAIYAQNLADPVIGVYRDECTSADRRAFFKVWFALFQRHPDTMMRGLISFKYKWLFPSKYLSFYYNVHASDRYIAQTNEKLPYANFSMDEPQHSLLTDFIVGYEGIIHLPGVGVLYTTFAVIFVMTFLTCYGLRKHRWQPLAFLLMGILQVAVTLVGPTNGAYYRYTFPLVMSLPAYLTLFLKDDVPAAEVGAPLPATEDEGPTEGPTD